MTASAPLRSNLIRLASSYPQGSNERKSILTMLANFSADEIGEPVSGPTGIPGSDAGKPWSTGEFTQQEFAELGEKQESGTLGKVASAERPLFHALVHLAQTNPEARGPILGMLRQGGYVAAKKSEDQTACGEDAEDMVAGKEAGCEKLPEGGMRDNCEAKKEEGKDEDDKADKKAADAELRSALIRLASEKPEFRSRLLPLITAHSPR